jgi:hypothetical protein
MKELLRLYRDAWRKAGYPGQGRVMLAFHMFCAETMDEAIRVARQPLNHYLKTLVAAAADWTELVKRVRAAELSSSTRPAYAKSARAASQRTSSARRTGEPSAESVRRAGEPSTESASRAREPSAGSASRAGEPSAGPARRAGEPSGGSSSRAREPSAGSASHAREPSAGSDRDARKPSAGSASAGRARQQTLRPRRTGVKRIALSKW